MDWLVEIQIRLIVAWQNSVNWTEPMHVIGRAYDYLPYFVAIVLLGYSRRLGVELFLLGSFSAALSPILKWTFHSARPYWISSEVNAYGPAESYGMPSGHVLAVATILFWTAWMLRGWGPWTLALAGTVAMGASRVYLGSHFIHDAVGAIIVAALVVTIFARVRRRVELELAEVTFARQIALCLAVALGLLGVGYAVRWVMSGVIDPPAWGPYTQSAGNLDPLLKAGGQFFVFGFAAICGNGWAHYDRPRRVWKICFAVLFGLAGYRAISWIFTRTLISNSVAWNPQIELVHQFLLSQWLLVLAPFVLIRRGILPARNEEEVSLECRVNRAATKRE